jgi:cysteine synthase
LTEVAAKLIARLIDPTCLDSDPKHKYPYRECYIKNILDVIGNTPIVRLNRVTGSSNVNYHAKLEFINPGGSIKDRIGAWLIQDAEKKGQLQPGGTVIEGTSGNTGIGLAIASAIRAINVFCSTR